MTRKKTLIVVGTVLAGIVTASVFAHGRGGGPMEHFIDRTVDELELNDSEAEAVRSAVMAHEPQLKESMRALHTERKALVEALTSGADPAVMEERARAVADQASTIVLAFGAAKRDLDAVLTPEQRAEFNEHLAHMAERHHGRHGGKYRHHD